MGRKLTHKDFLQKASDKFIYLEQYINSTTHMLVKCKKCGHEFKQTPKNNFKGRGCPKCASTHKFKTKDDVINDILEENKLFYELYDYSNVIYNGYNKKINILCKKCNKEFYQLPTSHKKGHGCPICNGGVNKDEKTIISNLMSLHPNLDFSNSTYIKSDIPINITCNICGFTFKKTPNKLQQGQGCPKCKMSKGEKAIEKFLIENDINYISQYTFDNCKYKRLLPFDFYIPDFNMCIEFDGEQYYNKFRFEKNNDRLKIRQKRDKIKSEFCINENIKLLRIPYFYFYKINEILLNILSN